MTYDYISSFAVKDVRHALLELFRVLNQKPEELGKYLADDNPALSTFPYVNGGLFADESIKIPPFTGKINEMLLHKASEKLQIFLDAIETST